MEMINRKRKGKFYEEYTKNKESGKRGERRVMVHFPILILIYIVLSNR